MNRLYASLFRYFLETCQLQKVRKQSESSMRQLDSNSPCVCSHYFLYAPENGFGRNHYCNPHNATQIMYNKLHTFQSACYSHNAYWLCRVASWSKYPVLISRANDHICRCFIHEKDKSAATRSYRQISYLFFHC
jgi:hypothetical protein